MEGTHLFNKSNCDVVGIVFDHQQTVYLPQGATAFFSKLVNFQVSNSNLSFIQRNDFRHMKNLKVISLNYNNLERIPEDSFVDLSKLKYLSLAYNKLKSLPHNIFHALSGLKGLYLNNNALEEVSQLLLKFNFKLNEVFLHDNRLKFISKKCAGNFENLRSFSLTGNICINKNFTGTTSHFIEEITNNCSSMCETEIMKVSECHEELFALRKEKDELQREILKLRNFLRSNLIV